MNRRAFELSMGFLVILIMTVVIFAGSIYFIRQFYVTTTELREEIDRNTEEQILALIREGSVVAIPINKATIARGKGESFWLGIQNILDAEEEFGIAVGFSSAYDPQQARIAGADGTYINDHWVIFAPGPHRIKNSEFKSVPIRIVVDNSIADNVRTVKGTYSFNVCVWRFSEYGASAPGDCGTSTSGANVPWYTRKVYKVFVEVP